LLVQGKGNCPLPLRPHPQTQKQTLVVYTENWTHPIISDKFGTRFKEIAQPVDNLRDQQRKERTWHENSWESRTKLHDQLDSRHREITAQIRAITNREARLLQLTAKA
jgi:galactokinase